MGNQDSPGRLAKIPSPNGRPALHYLPEFLEESLLEQLRKYRRTWKYHVEKSRSESEFAIEGGIPKTVYHFLN